MSARGETVTERNSQVVYMVQRMFRIRVCTCIVFKFKFKLRLFLDMKISPESPRHNWRQIGKTQRENTELTYNPKTLKNMKASPILTVRGSDAKWCFANGTASNPTQGVGCRGSQMNQGYFAFRAEKTDTVTKKRHRLKLQENLELGSEYTIGMWIHFPLAPKPLKKQPNTGQFKDTWQALEKHSWHVAIFSDGRHDSDTECEQHPLSFLARESVGMAAVVHDNTWADVGFVVNYERVDDHVGPYSPKDVTDGWHHFTVAARRGTAAGPKGTSTLFVDGVMVARANAAAMCPLRSLGGHPNTQKGEITQDVGAIAGIEVFCNTALDSDAVNALFRDTLRPIAIAMDKEEDVTTHADGQLYGTDGLIFGAPNRERHPPGGLPVDLLERIAGLGAGLEQTKANVARFLLSAKRGVALAGVSAASARATVVRPRAAVPQPPVPLEALPHGFLRKQPTNSKTQVGSGSAVDDDDEEDHRANPSVLVSQSGKAKRCPEAGGADRKAKRGPEAGGADDAIGLKDNPKRSKLQGPGGVSAGALNATAVVASAETAGGSSAPTPSAPPPSAPPPSAPPPSAPPPSAPPPSAPPPSAPPPSAPPPSAPPLSDQFTQAVSKIKLIFPETASLGHFDAIRHAELACYGKEITGAFLQRAIELAVQLSGDL